MLGLGQASRLERSAEPFSTPVEPKRRGLPTWLLTIIFALGFGAIVLGIYSLVRNNGNSSATSATASATDAGAASKGGAKANPYQQFIEISGVRITEDSKKKPVAKFVVINHSNAEIPGLGGTVTVLAHAPKSADEPVGTFSFSKVDLKPFESKDVTVPLNTNKPMVEMPDWQFIKTDVQITAPGA